MKIKMSYLKECPKCKKFMRATMSFSYGNLVTIWICNNCK